MSDKKFTLSVILKHPLKRFQIGKHELGQKPAEFTLNDCEQAELETAGPKKWVIVHSTKAQKKSKGDK